MFISQKQIERTVHINGPTTKKIMVAAERASDFF
jgi:hypothetical protein